MGVSVFRVSYFSRYLWLIGGGLVRIIDQRKDYGWFGGGVQLNIIQKIQTTAVCLPIG